MNRHLGWPFLTAIIAGLVAIKPGWGWLVGLALVPLFWWQSRPETAHLPTRQFVLVYLISGFGYYLVASVWLIQNNPAEWAQTIGLTAIIGQLLVWTLAATTLSVTWLLVGMAAVHFRGKRFFSWRALLIIAISWSLGEFISAFLVSVVTWAPAASLGSHWPIGALGFSAMESPLRYLAPLGGLYALTIGVVSINVALVWWLRRQRKKALAVAVVVGVLALVGSLLSQGEAPVRQVGYWQATIPAERSSTIVADITARRLPEPVDVLVLPEYSNLYTAYGEPEKALSEAAFANQKGLTVRATALPSDPKSPIKILYQRPDGQILQSYDKSLLVPAGEFLPLVIKAAVGLTGGADQIASFEANRARPQSDQKEHPFRGENISIGGLACSAIMSPDVYRRLTAEGSDILTNSASLIVFTRGTIYRAQNERWARFHALANARPFVQAGRGGDSYIMSASGTLLRQTRGDGIALEGASVRVPTLRTPYTLMGDKVLALLSLLVLAGLLHRSISRPLLRTRNSGRHTAGR